MELRKQLEGILSHHEECWSQLLFLHDVDREKFKEQLVNVASDMRSRLQKCMSCATALFDTNMQCLVHIMLLRREKSQITNSYEVEIQVPYIC